MNLFYFIFVKITILCFFIKKNALIINTIFISFSATSCGVGNVAFQMEKKSSNGLERSSFVSPSKTKEKYYKGKSYDSNESEMNLFEKRKSRKPHSNKQNNAKNNLCTCSIILGVIVCILSSLTANIIQSVELTNQRNETAKLLLELNKCINK